MIAYCRRVVEARWFEIMNVVIEAQPWPWIYFVSFILLGTFVMLNLFIAVVINNLEASKAAALEELRDPVTHEEVLDELKRTRDALAALQRRLETLPVSRVSDRS